MLVINKEDTTTPPKTQAQRTALSDSKMLEAAVHLICELGVPSTTLKAVGENAGYSRGLASYRFGNKDGLLTFVVRSIGDRWLETLQTAVSDKVGLLAIEAATDAHQQFLASKDIAIRAFYLLWFESINSESDLKSLILKIQERRRTDVREWIQKGISSGETDPKICVSSATEHFCSSIIGIVYEWLMARGSNQRRIIYHHKVLKEQMALTLTSLINRD